MRTAAKNSFRDGLKNALAQLNLSPINENKVFGIDHKKVINYWGSVDWYDSIKYRSYYGCE